MSIELRLTDVDPPTDEPARTIYRDIANLPDPTTLGITIRYFNHDDVGLYMQITGSATGYTFTPVNLGLLASGANAYKNLDNFASRAKPTSAQLPDGEMSENIILTLSAYTDSGYSILKWTFERTVLVIWINSADPAFTLEAYNNFDDGTVQGWAKTDIVGYSTQVIANDYVLSTPYSYKLNNMSIAASPPAHCTIRVYKSFTTPNKDAIYAIIDLRCSKYAGSGIWIKNIEIDRGTVKLILIGHPTDMSAANMLPIDRWIRLVAPLPKNTTLELRIIVDFVRTGLGLQDYGYWWMDDFKLISK